MKHWLFWEVVVPATFVAVFLRDLARKRRLERHMTGRQPRTAEEFGRHFFSANQAPIAARLPELLAGYTKADLSRLDPDDRLVEDLGIGTDDFLVLTQFVMDVAREFGIHIPDTAAERLLTLRDFVDYVAQTQVTTGE